MALAGVFLSIVAPAVGGMAQSAIETLINDTINGLVAPGLAASGSCAALLPSCRFNVALNPKISVKIIPEDHERVRVFTPPTLTVAKAGYNTFRLLRTPAHPSSLRRNPARA